MASEANFPGISRTETPVARPPSPPYIHIPAASSHEDAITLIPVATAEPWVHSFDLGVSGSRMSSTDIETITGGTEQHSHKLSQEWTYESRRQAQQILTYLFLGPASAARDKVFLQKNGITLLLAVRDARQAAARLLDVRKSAAELGIAAEYVDVSNKQELMAALPLAVNKINSHMLATGGRGKVLVCCESGNERSATLVAAFVMTMYKADLVAAVRFVQARRFCVNFDDDLKFLLRGYGDIVAARRMVTSHSSQAQTHPGAQQENARMVGGMAEVGWGGKKTKRGIAETSTDEEDLAYAGLRPESDLQRFSGRHLTPFVDRGGGDEMMG